MADCIGICQFEDDICIGCGRDFSVEETPSTTEDESVTDDPPPAS